MSDGFPPEMTDLLIRLGEIWASASVRPRISLATQRAWDGLVSDWIESDLPLVVRKGGIRGSEIQHESGRRIVIADNSPAQWAFSRASKDEKYTIADIRQLFERDEIPFTFATKKSEKAFMRYRRTLGAIDNVNKRGWKLCHVDGVGLSTATAIERIPIEELKSHCRRLLAPSNQFVIPLQWSGLGEVPEFIQGIRLFEGQAVRSGVGV